MRDTEGERVSQREMERYGVEKRREEDCWTQTTRISASSTFDLLMFFSAVYCLHPNVLLFLLLFVVFAALVFGLCELGTGNNGNSSIEFT